MFLLLPHLFLVGDFASFGLDLGFLCLLLLYWRGGIVFVSVLLLCLLYFSFGFLILKLCEFCWGACFLLAFDCFFVVFVNDLLIFFAWSCCPVFAIVVLETLCLLVVGSLMCLFANVLLMF